ncbi:MAG: hypothetical protein KGY45_04815 [Hadesarchaea archaeon]|nr:hypothetical protein [Hadesarchaea archaeon]
MSQSEFAGIISDLSSEIRSRLERLENRVHALELTLSGRSEEFARILENKNDARRKKKFSSKGSNSINKTKKQHKTPQNHKEESKNKLGPLKSAKSDKTSDNSVKRDFKRGIKDVFSKPSNSN